MKTVCNIVSIALMLALLLTCKQPCPENEPAGLITVYSSKNAEIRQTGVMQAVPVIDRYLAINPGLAVDQKIGILLDELSASYFNDLKIEMIEITASGQFKTLRINLAEDDDYQGPGTSDPYASWYGFFQGSAGGENTRITLVETILQRHYPGDWIDALEVFYQGEPFDVYDHIDLTGVQYRFE